MRKEMKRYVDSGQGSVVTCITGMGRIVELGRQKSVNFSDFFLIFFYANI